MSIIPFASALRSSAPSGVLQLDSFGRPVHLSGPGLIWNVPTSSPVGLRGASTPFSPSVALPDSMEPNLHYGTLQLKDGTVLDRSPAIPIPSPSEGLPATGAVPPSAAAAAYEEIPPAQLATGSMPNVSQRAVPPQAAPLSPLPLLPMQPLAVAAIPTCLPALDLPEFSLPMLQLRLPWALKIQQTKESAAIAPPVSNE
ncbi:hypothetical protein, conserved [Eimeria acervulina]|uniref:Uncharacterized protein n=1 Tax=Eimeria acervulina TaxID=5801 RepID=U6GJY7_EIMAC|nr:hypothetical protein, conserved [Eimeria acervulina]CDI80490.1 hypothetical protein, conserved [Eimeria acervulina]